MKVGRLTKLKSYFYDVPLKKVASENHPSLEIFYSNGDFKLTTSKVIYSWGKHYHSFGDAFNKLKIVDQNNIKSVLVLGWGIGSIATLLKPLKSIQQITGVDYDSALIEVFNDIFKQHYPFKIELTAADAMAYMKTCQQKFDLICSDIFVDDTTPAAIIETPYLKQITQALHPNGQVLLSKLNRTQVADKQNKQLEINLEKIGLDYRILSSFSNNIYHWRK